MEQKIRRIGILTSGGDAPGMNAAVRAAVRTCLMNKVIPVGIRRGYQGLIHADVMEMNAPSVNGNNHRGGTIHYTPRSEDFKTEAGQHRAAQTSRY
ncbi:MAG: 6-phosphofructokinase, partial [Clostridia bacterium]|nr:6-phosphofructokinase [Clostridia bacterium]